MRLYVAGKQEDKQRIREVMRLLKKDGHTITHDWTRYSASKTKIAMKDLAAVSAADVLIVILEKDLRYAGTFTEIGAALALNKPVFILGDKGRENIFTQHPLCHRVS